MSKIKESGADVVIAGVSGRFPNSRNLEQFANNLYNHVDMTDEDETRWRHVNPECPRRMGKISDIEKFDASFFGVSFRQARTMDPQSRMILEHAYECVLDSGMCPKELRGSKIGVFIGMSYNESEKKWIYEKFSKEGLGITGSAKAMMANRISFSMGITGPSFVLDTACSSSMYALDIAYKMISSGEIDGAIVGGTNLCLHPYVSLQFVRLGVVSKDGVCRPFDAAASGFTRAESNCTLFLQRRTNAKRVYATLLHSKTNCDGFKSEGINFPSSEKQAQLLTEFYDEIGISPCDPEIEYFEAHCTGTKVGDAEECRAIDKVMCKNRKKALLVGSCKSNMGHAEPSSGVCSISKVIIAFENGKIPPNINFKTIKPEITGIVEGRMKIVLETQQLSGSLIPVNSSGFGGANAHALLRQHQKVKINKGIPQDDISRLVFWSGRTEDSVNTILDSVLKQPLDAEFIGLLQSSQIASTTANLYKGYGIFKQEGDANANAICVQRDVQHFDGFKRPMVWVYSGMGSQWNSMGKALMKIPIFAESIEKSHNILLKKKLNLKEIITSTDSTTFDNILHSFVGIAAIQIGLTDILKGIGLEPDYIIGHSLGELGCAYADNCCTAEEMILSAYSRGKVSLETKVVLGSMAAVGLGFNQLKDIIPDEIEIACHNSFESSTISGPAENVAKFVQQLKAQGIFAKEVACSNIPYHSSFISEMGSNLLKRLQKIHTVPQKRSTRWISSSIPESLWHLEKSQYSSAEYQTNNVLNPVLFEEAAMHLPSNAICIEIAPYGLLQAILKRSMTDSVNISLTKRGEINNDQFLMSSLGRIYCNGYDMDISKLFPPVEFPVSRGTPMISPLIKWDHSEDYYVMHFEDCAEGKSAERKIPISLTDIEYEFIKGHCIDGRCIFPATGYIFLAWETFAMTKGQMYFDMSVEVEDVKFLRATSLAKDVEVEFTIVIQPGTGKFEISEGSSTLVTGFIKQVDQPKLRDIKNPRKSEKILKSRDFYKELRLRGYHYNEIFKSVIEGSSDGSYGKVKWDSNWIAFLDCLLQLKIIEKDTRSLVLPTSIQKITIHTSKHLEMLTKFNDDDDEAYFEAFTSNELKIIRSGGVEICNLQSSSVGRRKSPCIPVLESYEFVPYNCSENLSVGNACRIISQLFLENSKTTKVKAIEIDNDDNRATILCKIRDALLDLPLITSELIYLSSKNAEEDASDITIVNDPISIHKECSMIITSKNNFQNELFDNLIDGGFLIIRDFSGEKLLDKFIKISSIKSENETLTIFQRKKEEFSPEINSIHVTTTDFKWIEKTKKLMKNSQVLLVAENDQTSGVLGLVNCLRKEANGEFVRCMFIDDPQAPKFNQNNSFYDDQLKLNLAINVYRNGEWGSYRHFLINQNYDEKPTNEHCFANALVKSDLSSLKWLQGPLNSNDNLVKVHYAPLNFKDVMLATGKISAEIFVNSRLDLECVLGFEYSGMTNEKKRVMGLIPSGALATFIKPDRTLMWNVPESWSLAEAATVPCVYGTVYYAFFIKIHIEKGKSILIHAGSGGVGLAAIRVAFAYGLEVFTTVSTEEKKNFLLNQFPQLKSENIGNSRDTSFEDMIMSRTEGKGVDYVLNSLAEEKLHASIRCLGKGGKFLEIGKFDMERDTKIGMSYFLKELSFHSIMLDQLFYAPDADKLRLHELLDKDFKGKIIQPFKTNIFKANQIEQAFRYLASGKHMGKVILQIRENETDLMTIPLSVLPRFYCKSNHSYIIPGGLGGFGLELADWLVLRGCRKLVLSSSRGITKQYQAYRIKIWETYGVEVRVNTSDISSKIGCEQLIRNSMKLGPVGGIFNLAVVLRDAIFDNQDSTKFAESMAPKATATKYLDEISRVLCPELQYFVVFSSVTCGRGNAGQSNYGMANSVMERIIEQRHSVGLPAKAIQWGAVGEVGLVADMQEDKIDMEIGGTLQQRISSCLEELDGLLIYHSPIVGSMVVAEKQYSSSSSKSGNVLEVILNIMGIRDAKSISLETTFAELGMDSLMTVEIQQTLEREHNFVITTQDLRATTLAKLVENVGSKSSVVKDGKEESDPGVKLLIRNLGNEKDSHEILLHLSGVPNSQHLTLFIPGVEGVGGDVWKDVSKKSKGVSYMLQHKNIDNVSSFNSFILEIYAKIKKFVDNFREINLIGYSFGSLIALKIANIFEKEKKNFKLTLIDGSPIFLNTLVKNHLGTHDFEKIIETLILKTVIENSIPNENQKVLHIIQSNSSLVDKISALVNETNGFKIYTEKHITEMIKVILNRSKLIYNLDVNDFHKLNNVKIKLIRPQNSSLKDMESDYGLNKFSNQSIDVKFVSGDHLTMLDTEEFRNILNDDN